jgi:hypothetical protein
MKDTANFFARFAQLGYTRLVPIIPPKAPISEGSSLFKRIGTPQDARGKTPGIKGQNGLWFSFDWVPYEADERDYHRWHAMGAGVGIKTGNGLIAIDADTKNEAFAKIIKQTIDELIGPTPIRIGNYPKALYLARVIGPVQYQRIDFGENIAADGKPPNYERVEILSDGRQFVAQGIHPKTGEPYNWIKPIVPLDELPQITPQQVTNLLNTLRERLPEASTIHKEGGDAVVSQASLRGNPDMVRKAVQSIPNTSALFPSRESYRDMGYAIRAAVENEHDAFEIFSDWCDRWVEGDNDPGVVAADWSRMKPPYRRGAQWLYELAETHGAADKFSIGEVWFEDLENPDNPFAQIDLDEKKSATANDTFDVLSLEDLENRPPAEWLLARHVPQKSVGFVYSTPGAGKTFLVLDMALHIADGRQQWHGDEIKAIDNAGVLYIASEGSYGFRNRVAAWKRKHGNSPALSRRFRMIEQTINFMSADDISKLLRTVKAIQAGGTRLALVVVDTVSRAMPGADENLQKDMTRFVAACDAVRDAIGGAVIGVHHAGKAGDMRGSTVLLGAGDFVFRLERKKGATIGHLACEKQKDGPDGWYEPYRFDVVGLGEGETSVTVERSEMNVGPVTELTPDVAGRVLAAMREAWETGEPWSKAPQSKERYAVRRMVADHGFDAESADELLKVWEGSGMIATEIASSKSKLKGYKVAGDIEHSVQSDGIFA